MIRGLGCRIFLVGPDERLDYFDGTLTVIAHDISACGPNSAAEPVFLYRWTLPGDVLRRLQKEDILGKCYTLYCPFPPGVYKPGIKRVQLQVAFQFAGAVFPLYSDLTVMTLKPAR